jgi:acetyl-CoA carboxylase carboxyltransferase component
VVLRKAYGGGFITMNSKELGADLVFAWPDAQIGVVGPMQAVGFVHREEIAAAPDPEAERSRLAAVYASENATAGVAAGGGHVDEIVKPGDTRDHLAWALHTLGGKA